jgi:hypothetical protein
MRDIARIIMGAGSELGVHGGYYRFNNAALYRESIEALERHFGVRPCGIRNHLLRFSGPETWRAQAEAGFAYDATYGWADRLGPRDGFALPFFPSVLRPLSSDLCSPSSVLRPPSSALSTIDLLELPLTVMDTTLFRNLKLEGDEALQAAWKAVKDIADTGGLVTLLWHNNYFNEPEYWDWQMVYERLLAMLAPLKPWCATGTEINLWWRARAGIVIESKAPYGKRHQFEMKTPESIRGLTLAVRSSQPLTDVWVNDLRACIKRVESGFDVCFTHLRAGEVVPLAVVVQHNL